MKRQLTLAALSLSFAMIGNVYAGGVQSRFSTPGPTLPPDCISEIERIREDFAKVFSGEPEAEQKRLTIMIVPFSNASACSESTSRSRSGTLSGLSHPVQISDTTRRKNERILRRYKSESRLEVDSTPFLASKEQWLTGCTTAAGQIPVACGMIKSRILSLINSAYLTPPQKLLVLQKLCAPCSEGQEFIYGNIPGIMKLDPKEVNSIEASMEDSGSGLLTISCSHKDGFKIICFI